MMLKITTLIFWSGELRRRYQNFGLPVVTMWASHHQFKFENRILIQVNLHQHCNLHDVENQHQLNEDTFNPPHQHHQHRNCHCHSWSSSLSPHYREPLASTTLTLMSGEWRFRVSLSIQNIRWNDYLDLRWNHHPHSK